MINLQILVAVFSLLGVYDCILRRNICGDERFDDEWKLRRGTKKRSVIEDSKYIIR